MVNEIIKIRNLNFCYGDKIIFNNLNLDILNNSFTTILGHNGCGKSTLVRLITGLEESDNSIFVNNVLLNKETVEDIRKSIGVVFENPDYSLIFDTVFDNIAFSLDSFDYSNSYIESEVNKISNCLKISNLLDKNVSFLSGGEKQLVCLACALVKKPSILILDEAFSMIDTLNKFSILNLLKDIQSKLNLTIINITHDIEESLYSSNIILIDNNSVLISGSREQFYKHESILNELGFKLPFMVDLSNKLSYYGLLDRTIYDMEEMIDILWK